MASPFSFGRPSATPVTFATPTPVGRPAVPDVQSGDFTASQSNSGSRPGFSSNRRHQPFGFTPTHSQSNLSGSTPPSVSAKTSRDDRDEFGKAPSGVTEWLGSDMVTLIVGSEQKTFMIHEKVLCNKIAYFSNMFRGDFSEAMTKVATFPEDDAEAFDYLLRWVYDGCIPRLGSMKTGKDDVAFTGTWPCLKLYALADKLQVIEVIDRTLDSFMQALTRSNRCPDRDTMEIAFSIVPGENGLKRFIAQKFAWALVNGRWEKGQIEALCAKFPELARTIVPFFHNIQGRSINTVPDPSMENKCIFHKHEAADTCPWN